MWPLRTGICYENLKEIESTLLVPDLKWLGSNECKEGVDRKEGTQ